MGETDDTGVVTEVFVEWRTVVPDKAQGEAELNAAFLKKAEDELEENGDFIVPDDNDDEDDESDDGENKEADTPAGDRKRVWSIATRKNETTMLYNTFIVALKHHIFSFFSGLFWSSFLTKKVMKK